MKPSRLPSRLPSWLPSQCHIMLKLQRKHHSALLTPMAHSAPELDAVISCNLHVMLHQEDAELNILF